MNNTDKDQLRITPVTNYTAPSLPTLEAAKGNPAHLNKLPNRWMKKAAVIGCMALAGTIVLSGCDELDHNLHGGGDGYAPIYVNRPTEDDFDIRMHGGGSPTYTPMYVDRLTEHDIKAQLHAAIDAAMLEYRTHWGGSGSGPFYVAHLTEQEALGIIRAKLEAIGLELGATPPDYRVHNFTDFTLDLFDENRAVGLAYISWAQNNMPFFSRGGAWLSREVAEAFAQQHNHITVGAFFNPDVSINENERWWSWDYGTAGQQPTAEAIAQTQAEAKTALVAKLNAQVEAFVEWLKLEGVM